MLHRARIGVIAAATVLITVSGTAAPGPSQADSSTTAAPTTTAPPTLSTAPQPILVIGPAGIGADLGAIEHAIGLHAVRTGTSIEYIAVDDPNREFGRRSAQDLPGDVFLIDSGALLRQAAIDRTAVVIPRAVDTAISDTWGVTWTLPARLGDALYGAPIDSSIESLVWFQPAAFDGGRYDVPETWNQLVNLAEEMIDDDRVPFCGFDDDAERTRSFVDWTFELIVRSHDVSVYDQILAEELSYTDWKIFGDLTKMRDLWATKDVGFGIPEEEQNVGEDEPEVLQGAVGLLDRSCHLVHGGVEVAQSFPEGTRFADGTPDAIDVALFPGPRGNVPVIADVTYAVSRVDQAEVWSLIQYLGSAEFADDRRGAQGDSDVPDFQSAASGQDLFRLSLLELSLLDVMSRATESREHWSELAPPAVRIVLLERGEAVSNGNSGIVDALETIDAAF
jgi:ABC-type glycerol-3-phosphate transport system substrate-binding protein